MSWPGYTISRKTQVRISTTFLYGHNEIGIGRRPIGPKQQTTADGRPATAKRRLENERKRVGPKRKPRLH